jgi:DNA polymerase-3 subunit beta
MSILSSETYKGVIFKFEENNLTITTTNPEIGESKEDMEIDFSGTAIEVAFNPRYFIDTLNAIEEDEILLHIVSEDKPCIVESEIDKQFISVIMPMRI